MKQKKTLRFSDSDSSASALKVPESKQSTTKSHGSDRKEKTMKTATTTHSMTTTTNARSVKILKTFTATWTNGHNPTETRTFTKGEQFDVDGKRPEGLMIASFFVFWSDLTTKTARFSDEPVPFAVLKRQYEKAEKAKATAQATAEAIPETVPEQVEAVTAEQVEEIQPDTSKSTAKAHTIGTCATCANEYKAEAWHTESLCPTCYAIAHPKPEKKTTTPAQHMARAVAGIALAVLITKGTHYAVSVVDPTTGYNFSKVYTLKTHEEALALAEKMYSNRKLDDILDASPEAVDTEATIAGE